MKKNAFTLIELIAVIAILALIALVVFPAVNSVIKSSQDEAYEAQTATIVKAAKEYYLEHTNELPDESEGSTTFVNVDTLISEGFISNDKVNDPRKNNKTLGGAVKVTYHSNQYIYEYVESTTLTNSLGSWLYENATDKAVLKAEKGIYKGTSPSNYINYSNEEWRILKINNDNTIKIIRTTPVQSIYGSTASFSSSVIKTTLTNSVSSKALVVNTSWCTAQLGNECRQTTTETVGLLSTSEYTYASNAQACNKSTGENCYQSNYLSAYPGYTLNTDGAGKVYYINSAPAGNNALATTEPTTSLNAYPVVTISANAKITSGNGTQSNPYIVTSN